MSRMDEWDDRGDGESGADGFGFSTLDVEVVANGEVAAMAKARATAESFYDGMGFECRVKERRGDNWTIGTWSISNG